MWQLTIWRGSIRVANYGPMTWDQASGLRERLEGQGRYTWVIEETNK